MENKESELIGRINELAESEFELITIDQTTGIAYRRNTDWEWAGGNLYNPFGEVSRESLENRGIFNERVCIRENFWEEVKDDKFESSFDWSSLINYL